jgi:hypothetical protein
MKRTPVAERIEEEIGRKKDKHCTLFCRINTRNTTGFFFLLT